MEGKSLCYIIGYTGCKLYLIHCTLYINMIDSTMASPGKCHTMCRKVFFQCLIPLLNMKKKMCFSFPGTGWQDTEKTVTQILGCPTSCIAFYEVVYLKHVQLLVSSVCVAVHKVNSKVHNRMLGARLLLLARHQGN